MQSVRQYWTGVTGRTVFNFNWDAINHDSTVHVSAAEWGRHSPDLASSPRFVGAANVTVNNVSPHGPPFDPNHGVTFVVTVAWDTPIDIVTDIVVVEATLPPQPPEIQWRRLGFLMQTQQQTNWCWCAMTVSITNFYGGALTQCGFANTRLGQTTCCAAGGSAVCNVQSDMVTPLQTAGHLAFWQASAPTFAQIQTEIDNGRPVSCRIQWPGGGGHFVAVTGYLLGSTEFVAVMDPSGTTADIRLADFIVNYNTGTVDETHFTV
jgi:hypothetical protein